MKKQLYFMLFSWFFISQIHAAPPLLLEADQHTYPVGLHVDILEDPSGELTFAQVKSSTLRDRFEPSTEEVPNFGIANSTYWFRFEVKNLVGQSRHLAFEIRPPTLDYVEVYVSQDEGWQHWATGDELTFATRPVAHRHFVFPIVFDAYASKTVYVRLKSKSILRLTAVLTDSMEFAVRQHNETWVTGLIYGVIFIMTLYNVFIFFAVQEKIYLYYVLFNLSILLFALSVFGYGFQYLWPNIPWINRVSMPVFAYALSINIFLLTQNFLELNDRAQNLNRFINLMIGLSVLGMISTFFISPAVSLRLLILTVSIAMLLSLFTSWYFWLKGSYGAIYMVLGWTGFFICVFVFIGMVTGILPNNVLTRNAASFGLVPLVALISFGLAARINTLRTERMLAQQQALQEAQAKQKIAEENLVLQRDNLRMATELDVSQQIQKMVLPTPAEISRITHLDIACWMESADEVGGDYYDVLQYHDKVIVGMGDVTGHGLASGVLMLMVQTAIRTLSISNLTNPADFFRILNQTVYDNVQRMGIDKNLTLVVLDCQDHHVRISGQHEEILVVRHDKRIERVDTLDLGFMIGVERNIEHLVNVHDIVLEPGDGIVLYTDGITEAFDGHREQYGLERLCEVVKTHWEESAADIQQAVIDDFHDHVDNTVIVDDYTFMVIKKLP